MARETPTRLWNDSATPAELSAAIGWGAVGRDLQPGHRPGRAAQRPARAGSSGSGEYADEHPTASESDIGWAMVKELSVEAAALLADAFAEHRGRNGRLSVQTDPRLYRDADALVAQAVEFDALAPNVIVKIPATETGIRGDGGGHLPRRQHQRDRLLHRAAGGRRGRGDRARAAAPARPRALDVSAMGPVCTIMVGRLDDWLKAVAKRDVVTVDPGVLEWAGVAVFKRAYEIFQRARVPHPAAVGGLPQPHALEPARRRRRRHLPAVRVAGAAQRQRHRAAAAHRRAGRRRASSTRCTTRFPEFRRAYDADGMAIGEFQDFGATRKTLRQFLAACAELEGVVRDVLLPDPEK